MPRGEAASESLVSKQPIQPLSPVRKREIAQHLWGLDLPNSTRTSKYDAFFQHYQAQVLEHESVASSSSLTKDDFFRSIWVLENNSGLTRADLRIALKAMVDGGEVLGDGSLRLSRVSYGTMLNTNDMTDLRLSIDSAIATIVRAMFTININVSPGRILVGESHLDWHENQSFEALIQETFPVFDYIDEPHTPIKPTRLRARYLESYADVRIEWTRHLPDHLKLDLGPRSKVLRVFDLVSLLEITYEACREKPWQLPLGESLKGGCYEPAFLYETLQTIVLLFPTQDRQWLERKIHGHSSWFFRNSKTDYTVDPRLSVPFKCHHEGTAYKRPLTTRRELFARYPHWALRLHILYAEAEDPTPSSWFGRWAEQRRAARHTYSLTLVALVLANCFGAAATILAALQLWIAYAQWKDRG